MSEFTPWYAALHLSDLHAGQGGVTQATARRTVVSAIAEDIERRRQAGEIPELQLIAFTGDLLQSGGSKPKELDEAAELLDEIHTTVGLATPILFVPGNHDCARLGADRDARRLIDALRRGDERLDDALVDDADRARLTERFAAFTAFLERYPQHPASQVTAAPMTWRYSAPHPGGTITFHGLNSAWLANDNRDEKRLQLGRSIVNAHDIDKSSFNVLMLHHPLSWFYDHDEVEPDIRKSFQIMLSGHLHVPREEFTRLAGGRKTVRLGAGATWNPSAERDEDGRPVWKPDDGHRYRVVVLGMGESGPAIRVYPRLWVDARRHFVTDSAHCDEDQSFSEEPVDLPAAPASRVTRSPLATTSEDLEILKVAAERALLEFGKGHTAYPTDLSISEQFEKGLLVGTSYRQYEHAITDNEGPRRAVDDVVARILTGENALLLGRPGAGKSVAMYELARALSTSHLVFPFRLSALRRAYAEWKTTEVRIASARRHGAACVFLLDGLDEASVADGPSAFDLRSVLRDLSKLGPVVVSCRTADFEQFLAEYIAESLDFQASWKLQPWRHDVEFADFVERLRQGSLADETALLRLIHEEPRLQELVSCPLFARMLTLVGAESARNISEIGSLYEQFFQKLSARTDVSLREAGCELGSTSLELWQELAWVTFRNGLLLDESLNLSAALSLIEDIGSRSCIQRSVATIVDVSSTGEDGRFVHYSFFHFLLAGGIESLMRAAGELTEELKGVLSRDLPRPVRHFLVSRLARTREADVLRGLVAVYRELRSGNGSAVTREARLVGCNLIAYITSRAFGEQGESALRDLLADEAEPFTTNSLRWALCHVGAMDIAESFAAELQESARYAAICRGYLLYYHGDLTREASPPFYDDDPTIPWVRARAAILEIMDDVDYFNKVATARIVMDVYTFLTFALYRSEILLSDDCRVIDRVLGRLRDDGNVPDLLFYRLAAMHAATCGFRAVGTVRGQR